MRARPDKKRWKNIRRVLLVNHLGIIGGTGLYKIDDLEIINEHDVDTPFGKPSAPVIEGKFSDAAPLFFLPRHGLGHSLLPSEVNYRANIFALKSLGVRRVVSVSATGSLREEIKPGDMALMNQYFDHTKGKREASFFGRGIVAHISTAQPACPALSGDIMAAAKQAVLTLHTAKTYACVEGPRLGTRAESLFLRQAGCDVVGMTNLPEAFLAREAQMAYCTIAIATDYDCWLEDPAQHAQADEIMKLYFANIEKVKSLVRALASVQSSPTPEWISDCLKYSIITPIDKIPKEQEEWLTILRR